MSQTINLQLQGMNSQLSMYSSSSTLAHMESERECDAKAITSAANLRQDSTSDLSKPTGSFLIGSSSRSVNGRTLTNTPDCLILTRNATCEQGATLALALHDVAGTTAGQEFAYTSELTADEQAPHQYTAEEYAEWESQNYTAEEIAEWNAQHYTPEEIAEWEAQKQQPVAEQAIPEKFLQEKSGVIEHHDATQITDNSNEIDGWSNIINFRQAQSQVGLQRPAASSMFDYGKPPIAPTKNSKKRVAKRKQTVVRNECSSPLKSLHKLEEMVKGNSDSFICGSYGNAAESTGLANVDMVTSQLGAKYKWTLPLVYDEKVISLPFGSTDCQWQLVYIKLTQIIPKWCR
jgi:hypothetical protein